MQGLSDMRAESCRLSGLEERDEEREKLQIQQNRGKREAWDRIRREHEENRSTKY